MREIQDLLERIASCVFIVCGVILMIALTSAIVLFFVETIIDIATNGINGI